MVAKAAVTEDVPARSMIDSGIAKVLKYIRDYD